jgi:hypothetical protein
MNASLRHRGREAISPPPQDHRHAALGPQGDTLYRHRYMIFLKFKGHRCPIEHTGLAAAVATRAKREIGSFSASAAPPSLMLPTAVAISVMFGWLPNLKR